VRSKLGLAAFVAASLCGTPSAAQSQAATPAHGSEVVYQREIFRYPRSGRPDPFRSLLGAVETGFRAENLVLRGIVHSSDPGASFAVVTEGGSNRAMRLRVGQRLGNVQVVAIYPRRVDLVIQDLRGARRESLVLRQAGQQGTP
jgi:hypothetical protein